MEFTIVINYLFASEKAKYPVLALLFLLGACFATAEEYRLTNHKTYHWTIQPGSQEYVKTIEWLADTISESNSEERKQQLNNMDSAIESRYDAVEEVHSTRDAVQSFERGTATPPETPVSGDRKSFRTTYCIARDVKIEETWNFSYEKLPTSDMEQWVLLNHSYIRTPSKDCA